MNIREIHTDELQKIIAQLCIKANCIIPEDIMQTCKTCLQNETDDLPKYILSTIIENGEIAKNENVPICQDTGMAVVFLEIGQDVHLIGDNLEDAVNKGVSTGYTEGYLRKSVVVDPINRVNTKNNTPAVLHTKIVPGDKIKIIVAPKGFGSENMSKLYMLKPSDGIEGVKNAIVETVKLAGSNPCPPIIVGVGVGGTIEMATFLAKTALLVETGERNEDVFWSDIEKTVLCEVNKLGVGPGGFGGNTTALDVHIKTYPTHIAGLPVAINIGCHVTRHAEFIL